MFVQEVHKELERIWAELEDKRQPQTQLRRRQRQVLPPFGAAKDVNMEGGQTPAPRSESEQRRYQENRYKKYEEKPSSNWRGPKLVVQGNKHCYECVPCNTMHSAEFICPKFYESEN